MLPPEITRIVLLIGLAATGYLMILAWNEDMEAQRAPVGYSDAPLSAGQPTQTVTDTPQTLAPAQTVSDSDVPQSSLLIEESTSEQPIETVSAQVSTNQLITVETATLKLWIDPVGGDIVRTQLPQFPISLEQQDVPFMLMDRSPVSTYIAQSGLIGADGPDAKGRPVYTSATRELRVPSGETRTLTLTTLIDGGRVDKNFTFRGDDYLLDVECI